MKLKNSLRIYYANQLFLSKVQESEGSPKPNCGKIDVNISIRIDIMKPQTVRTTLTLPSELLEDTDLAVSQGKARSRNEFVAQALRHELNTLKMAEIDAAFADMANDTEYQAEARQIEAEFAPASWEALAIGEREE
jgi:Arc/MetJ-type ribon-helix-helix transcriptional regulator